MIYRIKTFYSPFISKEGGIHLEISIETQAVTPFEFITALKGSGPFCFRTLPDITESERTKENYARNWTFSDESILQSSLRGALPWSNSHRNGVFVVVNGGGHSDACISNVTAQYIDFDHVPWERQLQLLKDFDLPPSFLVLPNRGLHAYWLIKDGEVDQFRTIQKRLIQYFGSDPSIVNESRVMRVPGFYHQKGEPKLVKVVWWHPELVYTQTEIAARLSSLDVPEIVPETKLTVIKEKSTLTSSKSDTVDIEMLGLVQGHVGIMTTADEEQYRCLCPMHNDHNPSGTYFAGNEWFHCRTCQRDWSLSELAALNGWTDILEYRDKRRKTSRLQGHKGYDIRLSEQLNLLPRPASHIRKKSNLNTRGTQRIVRQVVESFEDAMKSRELGLTSEKRQTAETIVGFWDRLETPGMPLVWGAVPGSGKSTLRDIYVDIKRREDSNFGCVIVVERKEDADRIAGWLNRTEEGVAWSYLGWDADWCLAERTTYQRNMCQDCAQTKCRVLRNQQEQLQCQVVITTHQRFLDLNRKGTLGSILGYWIDSCGERHRRKLLIIDEALPLITEQTVSRTDIERFNGTLQRLWPEYPSLLDAWQQFCRRLASLFSDIVATRYVQSSEVDNLIPPELRRALTDLPSDTWPILDHFLEHGGILYKDDDEGWTLTVTDSIPFKCDRMCPFVLDGTANHDPRYLGSDFQVIPTNDARTKSISIHVCTDFGFGKRYMARADQQDILQAHAEVARDLASKHNKLLLVVRKDYEPKYRECLKAELDEGRMAVAHFGDLKGKNEYRDCDAVVFYGVLDKGDQYYLSTALTRQQTPQSLCLEARDYGPVHRFQETSIEAVKVREIAVELIQDMFRTQVRSGRPINVYVFSRDELLMMHVAALLGLSEVDFGWKPTGVMPLTKAHVNVLALLDALQKFVRSGNMVIQKSELKELADMNGKSDKVWRRTLNHPYIQAYCYENNIGEPSSNSRVLVRTDDDGPQEVKAG